MARQTDLRTRTGTDKGHRQGYVVVQYHDVKGRTFNARVLGQGSTSGLKLQLQSGRRIIDNVALGTSPTQTNVYYSASIAGNK